MSFKAKPVILDLRIRHKFSKPLMKSYPFTSVAMAVPIAIGILIGCSSSTGIQERTQFSRLDSLTDTYLILQDSVLQSWNRVVRDEHERTEAMREMIEKLKRSTMADDQQIASYRASFEQLDRIRFTQKTMIDPYVVEEYDRACTELSQTLTKIAGTSAELQTTVEWLQTSKVDHYYHRFYYDSLARSFNRFVFENKSELAELSNAGQLEEKPLFSGH